VQESRIIQVIATSEKLQTTGYKINKAEKIWNSSGNDYMQIWEAFNLLLWFINFVSILCITDKMQLL